MSESESMAPAWSDSAAAVTPATILRGRLKQHAFRALDEQRVQLIACALGPPRLWEYLLRGALDGFEDGYARPHDGRMSTRLHQGALVAQQTLRRRVEGLIERRPSDVGLMAVASEGPLLHVLSAGALSAHLVRAGTVRRVGPAEESGEEGLLKLAASWSTEPLAAGDLVLAGSRSATGSPAIDPLRAMFASGIAVPPRQAVELLQRQAVAAGIASVVLALRVSLS